ncbi:MAG: PEGA domain-containing protein [Methanocorpusculum sp.]|nr:PEGA domain-containing protein [Methanocorpusculum sp.]
MNKRIFLSAGLVFMAFLLVCSAASAAEDVGGSTVVFHVSSSPGGATAVFQSSGESHTTPCSFTVHSGTRYWGVPTTITISMPGYETVTEKIYADDFADYAEYSEYSLNYDLVPIAQPVIASEEVTFSVYSVPSGAKAVYQATGEQLTTPGSFTIHSGTAAWGRSTFIEVSKAGYESYTYPVSSYDFIDGITYYVDAELTPYSSDGYLSLSSSPSGALAYVDGSYVGTTPTDLSVSEGYHTVSIQKSGYTSWSGSATITAGQTTYLSGTLSPIQTYGYLSVSSNPSHADIYINGVYKGQTPATLTMTEGSYSVDVRKSGYKSYLTNVYIGNGQTSSVYAELSSNPSTGYVKIATFPAGASVYIDGTYVGKTPVSPSQSNPNYMSAGPFTTGTTHSLSLTLDKYQPYSTSFKTSASEVKQFIVTLSPAAPVVTTASITVVSTPSGADLFIDNQYYGKTPFSNSGIQPGTHTVRVAASGYTDWTQTYSFAAGQMVDVNAVLSSGAPSVPTLPPASPLPIVGLLAGLGAAAVLFAGRKF